MVGASEEALSMLEHEPPRPAPAPPPLRESYLTVDGFLAPAEAQAIRAGFEGHFAEPQGHRPDTHQLWNYWYVPGLYTYLRTNPEKVVPRALVEHFHAALTRWASERLGLAQVTWPNLSLYVDGCCQHLHNDSANGRFGYVWSLTLASRRSCGGETLLLREGDLFRANARRAAAGVGMHDLVAADFNRLTVFDDRIPHGVQRVEGSMDPLDGRVVLHGHISEAKATVEGPLAAEAVWDAVRAAADPILRAHANAGCHGPLCVRARIGSDGAVEGVRLLVDRVIRTDGGDPKPATEAVLAALAALRFPPADGASEATLPIMFGGPLPWMVQPEGAVVSRIAPSPASASRLAEPAEAHVTVRARAATATAVPAAAAPAAAAVPPAPSPRAAIGEKVRKRLLGAPKVAKIPKDRLEAFVVRDFLSEEECAGLIRLIDAGKIPSGLLAPSADPEFRTSESCNLNPADPLVGGVEERINALMGIDPINGETVQGQRYAVGQQFKAHHDFFHTDQPYWPALEKLGGQRTWTVMAFLNKPEAGGQTLFPDAGLRITPAAGYLLVWNNLDIAGEPNPFSLHQGLPVEAGVNYVITKWYRERPWNRPADFGA